MMTRANKRVMATVEQPGNSAMQTEGESLAGTSRSNENNTLQIAEVNRTNMRDVSVISHSSDGHSNLGNYSTTGLSTSLEPSVTFKGLSPGYKLASSIIPEYDGENIPVSQFLAQCRAAASVIEPREMKYLILLIRTKIVKDARRHVRENGKDFKTLDELLNQVENCMQLNDSSLLLQQLTTITSKPGETIPKYGSRTFALLTELPICLEREHPGEMGKTIAAGMTQTVAKHFTRGLDKDTLDFLSEKYPTDLNTAINLSIKADIECRSWRETHNSVESEKMAPSENPRFNNYGKTQYKQVASIKSGVSVPGPSREGSLTTVQCFGCKEFGHVRRNCPNSRDNDGSRERSGGMSCDYCHYENHGVEQCYLKRKHDKERAERLAHKQRTKARGDHLNSKGGRPGNAPTRHSHKHHSHSQASAILEREPHAMIRTG